MSVQDEVEIVGGGLGGLTRAVELARGGSQVRFVEPGLRAGGAYATESFLTPFRFNLGPALVPRPPGPTALLEPDPLLAVGDATLGRSPIRLLGADTAAEAVATLDSRRRGTLTALAVLLGIDPSADGSGAALAAATQRLGDLVAVDGGNGMVAAALLDELVARGGHVQEGAGSPADGEPAVGEPPVGELGVCRLFVGLRRAASPTRAFATAVGFEDAATLLGRLDELRRGEVGGPLGFLLDNSHLDPKRPGDPLGSFVWQGILPLDAASVSRRRYVEAVLAAVGVEPGDVVFELLWLPADTGERLA
jgi:hypothetical protein